MATKFFLKNSKKFFLSCWGGGVSLPTPLVVRTLKKHFFIYVFPKHKLFFEFYKPNMTDLHMLGNRFCKFGLVSTYQRFSAGF